MTSKSNSLRATLALAALLSGGTFAGSAYGQKADVPKTQDKVAIGEDEVKQLLILMDADKNGKISRQEFTAFMQAEFDRLDRDKSGELDQKELSRSMIKAARPSIGK
jgi:Ca2+-binding EF-hand superfamily protein